MSTFAVWFLDELSFRGQFPWQLAVGLFVLAAAGTVVFYAREIVRVGAGARVLMAGLRIAAFAVLAFLLLRPVWVSEVTGERKREVALLIDNSQSLTNADERDDRADQLRAMIAFDRRDPAQPLDANPSNTQAFTYPEDIPEEPTRAEILRAVFSNPSLNLPARLAEVGPMRPFLFGQRLRAVTENDEWLDAVTVTDSRTALADAGLRILDRDPNELPTALVVATDGRDNASSESFAALAKRCEETGVPLHVYGTGVSRVGFVRLRSAEVPETLFVDDTVEIPVRWQVRGFDSGTVELSLRLDGRKVGEPKRIRVEEGDDLRETLTFTPTEQDVKDGKTQPLEVCLRLIDGAQTHSDSLIKRVAIDDGKIKVLAIANAPNWEFKFLQRALLRDRRVEPSFHIIEGDPKEMRSGEPFIADFPDLREDFFAYDLLILSDVPAEFLTKGERMKWVREFVTDGRGLIAVAGRRHLPADYADIADFAEMLPVEFEEVRFPIDSGKRTEEYQPRLTDAAEQASMLLLADTREGNADLWAELPGWEWHYPVTKLRPAGVSLLVHPREKFAKDEEPMPLLAIQNYGRGRVLFAATDETWRWRYNEQNTRFARYWGQVIYRMGYRPQRGPQTTRLELAQSEPVLGTTGRVYARLLTSDFLPLRSETVSGTVEKLDPEAGEERYRTVTFESIEGRPGEYLATLPHDRAGQFTLSLEATDQAAIDYRVSLPPEHELAPGGMNEAELRRLAEQSGGRFYREEDLHELPSAIEGRSTTYTERREVLLWNWWMLALFVGLVSAEWLVRKFTNLS